MGAGQPLPLSFAASEWALVSSTFSSRMAPFFGVDCDASGTGLEQFSSYACGFEIKTPLVYGGENSGRRLNEPFVIGAGWGNFVDHLRAKDCDHQQLRCDGAQNVGRWKRIALPRAVMACRARRKEILELKPDCPDHVIDRATGEVMN